MATMDVPIIVKDDEVVITRHSDRKAETKGTLVKSTTSSSRITPLRNTHPISEIIELEDLPRFPSESVTNLQAQGGISASDAAKYRFETVGFAAVVLTLFVTGWNDGTQGPLLPRIQEHYGVMIIID